MSGEAKAKTTTSRRTAAPVPAETGGEPGQLTHGIAVRHAMRAFTRALSLVASQFSVSPAEYRILRTLGEASGLTQLELARKTAMDRPFVSLTIKHLRAAGLVTSHQSKTDRRRVDVVLTRKGDRLRRALVASLLPSDEAAAAGISPDDMIRFHEILGKMTTNVDNYCAGLEAATKQRAQR